MNELTHAYAVILGVVQGLTEFLPVSSSGHLAITQRWLGLKPESPEMLLFDVLAHVGTVVAVLIVFRRSLALWLRRLALEYRGNAPTHAWRLAGLALMAMLVTAAVGLTFQGPFESAFEHSRLIGGALLVTGLLLLLTGFVRRPKSGWRGLRWWHAALVGLAQALAIVPGISRSGATICAATFLGLRRRWAAEFSFLIAVPAIIGAAAIKTKDTFELPAAAFERVAWSPMLVGAIVSLVVGVIALKLLLTSVRRAKLHFFSPYCFVVGLLLVSGVI